MTVGMKSTKEQTLGAVYTFRHANGRHGSVNSACKMSLEPANGRQEMRNSNAHAHFPWRRRSFRASELSASYIH